MRLFCRNELSLHFTMKAVIQRVVSGSVSVNGELISSIGKGIVALIGIHRDDTKADMDYIVRKLLSIRLWEDDQVSISQ